MYIKLFLKEWRENLLIFLLAVMLMLAMAGLSLTDQKTLTLYFAGMFLWLFLPFAGMLLGSGAFYSEFKDNAWIYIFSRPVRKEMIWVVKYLAGLSMLLIMYLIFSGLMRFMPGMFEFFQDITTDSSLSSPLMMILALSISFSLSILYEKQFIVIFTSVIISLGLALLFQQYQTFLFNTFFYYGDLLLFPFMVALSFMTASVMTLTRVDFSQAGAKVFYFTKTAAFLLIVSFLLCTAWVVKERGFSGRRPYAWFRSAEYGDYVYFQTYDNGIIRYNSKIGGIERIDQGVEFSYRQFSVKNGKILFFQRTNTRESRYEDLWIMNTDGTEKNTLIEASSVDSPFYGFYNGECLLSEDGARLVFSAQSGWRRGKKKFWVMSVDGTGSKEFSLNRSLPPENGILAWIPQEDSLLLKLRTAPGSPLLLKYDLKNEVSKPLLIDSREPEISIRGVSPQGDYVLFSSFYPDERFVLSLLDTRTGEKKDIQASESLAHWRYNWNRNEGRIAFYKNNEFWVYNIINNDLTEIKIRPHKFGVNFDWVENENKLVINDYWDGRYFIRIFDLDLKEEKTIGLPQKINNPRQIWGVRQGVLLKNYRRGNLWRIDLITEELTQVY